MAETPFNRNLLRVIADTLIALSGLYAPPGRYGKNYFSLETGDKSTVDQAVMEMIGHNYDLITAGFLAAQMLQNPVGFAQTQENSSKPSDIR